jgi:hypothetical protein
MASEREIIKRLIYDLTLLALDPNAGDRATRNERIDEILAKHGMDKYAGTVPVLEDKLWADVADDLAELNLFARAQLARPTRAGRRSRPADARSATSSTSFLSANAGPLPWPDWAPAPGSWIRETVLWRSGRRSHGPTWHIAGPFLWEAEWDYRVDGRVRRDFRFEPLCGRDITVHRPGDAFDHVTLDVRLATTPDDKECWHCRRKLALIGEVGPGHRYFATRTVGRS